VPRADAKTSTPEPVSGVPFCFWHRRPPRCQTVAAVAVIVGYDDCVLALCERCAAFRDCWYGSASDPELDPATLPREMLESWFQAEQKLRRELRPQLKRISERVEQSAQRQGAVSRALVRLADQPALDLEG
jgi:hypothetical protein